MVSRMMNKSMDMGASQKAGRVSARLFPGASKAYASKANIFVYIVSILTVMIYPICKYRQI